MAVVVRYLLLIRHIGTGKFVEIV
ncbi:Protein of unknown function [Bacillus cytotoxicus]|uniref:Uncharacterized protein n=1 Tax=Bacillus cytotoxicus TaxID=580165 RepID=A0AAX2CNE9_9BACI|nr:Protein of unknown function [Bacillus cytotoxicus]